MVLVIGPNGSGKSAAAERLCHDLHDGQGALVYVATLMPAGADGRRRVARHRRQRAGQGFTTIEAPTGDLSLGDGAAPDVVLLEDVSNLLANFAFARRHPDPVAATLDQVAHLRGACRHLVVVTIGGLAPEPGYDVETVAYIGNLDRVNDALRRDADQVIEMSGAEVAP